MLVAWFSGSFLLITGFFGRLPIRWRLSLWYGAVLAIVLAGFGGAVYGMMRSHMIARTDAALFDELSEVEDEIGHAKTREELQRQLERRFGNDANNEYQIAQPDGQFAFRSRRLGTQTLPLPPKFDLSVGHAETVPLHDHLLWRVASRLIPSHEGDLTAQVATSLQPDKEILNSLGGVMLIVGPIAIGAALVGGYLLARHALAPVDRMVTAASEITAARLDRRLTVGASSDELSRLATALNKMMERLDDSFCDMQRFTSDAAHELRTPLAIIHNAADVGLSETNTPPECRRVYEDILEEVDRLSRLADQLLYLTREDVGVGTTALAPVQLDTLVREVVDHMRLVAEDKEVSLVIGSLKPTLIDGDADRLRRLMLNLLDNAIKFTPRGGQVVVAITSNEDGSALLSVSDTGIGIAAEHLPHIFERFYRVDPARGAEHGGAGLGLAISKAIVQWHGGDITAISPPSGGTCVQIRFPLPCNSGIADDTGATRQPRPE
jgi:two-component system heavy metal sensor histidine kinase CusS